MSLLFHDSGAFFFAGILFAFAIVCAVVALILRYDDKEKAKDSVGPVQRGDYVQKDAMTICKVLAVADGYAMLRTDDAPPRLLPLDAIGIGKTWWKWEPGKRKPPKP